MPPMGRCPLWALCSMATIAAGTRLPIHTDANVSLRRMATGPIPPQLPTLPNYSVIPCAS
jgi:hypothetical protein